MRQWMVFFVGLLMVVAGCAAENGIVRRPVAFGSEADNVKIMTFNIRYGLANDGADHWDARRDGVFDRIAKQGADVVGVQEALGFQMDQLGQALSGYKAVGVGRDDGKRAGEFCGIFYRKDRFTVADSGVFWFSNSPWTKGSMHWGNLIPRICTWVRLVEKKTARAFYVYDVHFDHQSQVSRQKSAELLAQRVAQREPKDPVVVLGDFNTDLDNPALLYLRRVGYADAPVELLDTWRRLYPNEKETGTYHAFTGKADGGKIDHILTEPSTEVLDAQIDRTPIESGRYPSDHFPVTVVLKLWTSSK